MIRKKKDFLPSPPGDIYHVIEFVRIMSYLFLIYSHDNSYIIVFKRNTIYIVTEADIYFFKKIKNMQHNKKKIKK